MIPSVICALLAKSVSVFDTHSHVLLAGSDGDTMSASGAGTHVAPSSTSKEPTRFVANVVLVVRAGTPRNVINAYHSLVQRITVGLQHEQRRVNYV